MIHKIPSHVEDSTPTPTPTPKPQIRSPRRMSMKNNFLHIEHDGSNPKTASNTYIQSGRILKAGAGYNGRIDKYRCTSLARANEIAAHLKGSIKRATFKDRSGVEYQIA